MRFATKRFIGEYDCTTDRIYRVDNQLGCSWEIADPPGYPAASAEPKLRWADAIVLVYSVTDRISFEETSRLRYVVHLHVSLKSWNWQINRLMTMRVTFFFLNYIRYIVVTLRFVQVSIEMTCIGIANVQTHMRECIIISTKRENNARKSLDIWYSSVLNGATNQSFSSLWSRFLVSHARRGRKVPPVVLLVGNKADLSGSPGERMVSALEGQKRAKEIEAHAFHEISARESVDQVRTSMNSIWTN